MQKPWSPRQRRLMSNEYYVGLMSGTSMDGIDAALVEFETNACKLVASCQHAWPETLRETLLQTQRTGNCTLSSLAELDTSCGIEFAKATQRLLSSSKVEAAQVKAIGSHGQTLCHGPDHHPSFSLQIGDPNRIAEITGITTVADFRRRDLAAGGQGAPLAPAFHQAVFQKPGATQLILNIGGIANLTVLPADQDEATGFDTGPGNCLLDAWCQQHTGNRFDNSGDWAKSGSPEPRLLLKMLEDPYFSKEPPKSTGTEYFSPDWLHRQLQQFNSLPARNVQRTLLELTALTIANEVKGSIGNADSLLVCGGGVHNDFLMLRLQHLLPQIRVSSTAVRGVDPDWLEAMAFAWLARETLAGRAGNLPSVTGASHPVVLGGIYG